MCKCKLNGKYKVVVRVLQLLRIAGVFRAFRLRINIVAQKRSICEQTNGVPINRLCARDSSSPYSRCIAGYFALEVSLPHIHARTFVSSGSHRRSCQAECNRANIPARSRLPKIYSKATRNMCRRGATPVACVRCVCAFRLVRKRPERHKETRNLRANDRAVSESAKYGRKVSACVKGRRGPRARGNFFFPLGKDLRAGSERLELEEMANVVINRPEGENALPRRVI